jgi:alkylation response protein AidB-like acyl-CoA dehydrogenase
MDFAETDEQRMLRSAVASMAGKYGHEYIWAKAKAGEKTTELWAEAGKAGFLGVAVPEQYGGGGGGMGDLSIVLEELGAAGCPLLMMVVSPAICGTVISRFGTDGQKEEWLPGIADGSTTMAFAITEPDAGSNSHNITTSARPDPDGGWRLTGHKYYISGVDESDATLVVARMQDSKGTLRPAMFMVPTDSPGYTYQPIEMAFVAAERQFSVFFDDVHLPDEALIGGEEAGLKALFAGLNPERITVAAQSNGLGRYALEKGAAYARDRSVWGKPIGAHQAVAHPLAKAHIEVELARLATTRAAWLYDQNDPAAGEAANVAKYAAAEAAINAVDASVQAHGGNGMSAEYGIGPLIGSVRTTRIAPVSREMILNFVAQHTLGLPKSY